MITGQTTTRYRGEAFDWLEEIMKSSWDQKEYYEGYMELSETWIREKAKTAKEELERLDKEYAFEFEELGDVNQFERNKLGVLETINPKILYNSLFLTIYTYLEEVLREICKSHYLDHDDKIIPRYKRNIIINYYSIIQKFGDFSSLEPLWKEILQLREWRNDIVHNKYPKPVITKQIVADLNLTIWDFVYGIYKLVELPDDPPTKALIPRV
ncbi:hypothetical protein GO495_21535 [Chitinophaga oryziterrae]|uniref:Apea-like HEPN domain-containing protein n=1 Tax=Chitinophaga oryziterrae TaxID=1031224 RepID=A0A6N8JE11_9BACT|nr:hypothetical protein [Chitinophaga oryziterrae]MVT43194.1 hypothetical protein [Chitinophaga oryziterrae]